MRTLRIYLWKEIAAATGFMLFALLSLFTFFDLVAQRLTPRHDTSPCKNPTFNICKNPTFFNENDP